MLKAGAMTRLSFCASDRDVGWPAPYRRVFGR